MLMVIGGSAHPHRWNAAPGARPSATRPDTTIRPSSLGSSARRSTPAARLRLPLSPRRSVCHAAIGCTHR